MPHSCYLLHHTMQQLFIFACCTDAIGCCMLYSYYLRWLQHAIQSHAKQLQFDITEVIITSSTVATCANTINIWGNWAQQNKYLIRLQCKQQQLSLR